MRSPQRKSTPKVRGGKVQRKNRTDLSPNYYNTPHAYPTPVRQRPGVGYRPILNKKQLYQFIDLLPDCTEFSRGLRAVLLAPDEPDMSGWHVPRTIAICAWDSTLEEAWPNYFVDENHELLNRLGVIRKPDYEDDGRIDTSYQQRCFTEKSARGFQLMDVFRHEMGHHHDRMTSQDAGVSLPKT
jgi:hypothetical protein